MVLRFTNVAATLLCAVPLMLAGCGRVAGPVGVTADSARSLTHTHEHPDRGPHGGDVVELGNEEYHAEIVHERDGRLSVYILDGAAATAVPIETPDVTINVVDDGQPMQFRLAAAPTDADPAGSSSRFVSTDDAPGRALDRAGARAKLAVTIDGTNYQGAIAHQHVTCGPCGRHGGQCCRLH